MKTVVKPLVVIVIAIGIAAGAAMYLSRTPVEHAEDKGPSQPVQLKGGHFRGPENAQVTLVEFGDFECPSCGAYHPFVNEILSRYPDKLRLEFHNFPLIAIHPNAMLGAMAAEAAGDQGKYWEMHDLLFEHQREWGENRNAEVIVMALASRLGLDMNKFMQALRSPALQDRILRDEALADQLKLNETPSFLIDGQRVYPKASIQEFVDLVEAHLHK